MVWQDVLHAFKAPRVEQFANLHHSGSKQVSGQDFFASGLEQSTELHHSGSPKQVEKKKRINMSH